MRDIAFRLFLGAAGGFIGWAIVEPTAPPSQTAAWQGFETTMTLAVGGLIGFLLSGWSAWQQGSRKRLVLQSLLGLLCGAVGALMGKGIGGLFAVSIVGIDFWQRDMASAMIGRTLVGTGVGLCLGAGIGLVTADPKKIIRCLIAGTIGGAVGGVMFDPLGMVFGAIPVAMSAGAQETGQFSRGLLFTLIGGFVGLFIGAVERWARTAWLRLNLGRNEGREWELYKHTTMIGRSEVADVPLYGDQAVAPNHASIVRQGDQFWLFDGGAGVLVNGAPIQQVALLPGSVIQVGGTQLQFLVKKGSAVARAAEQLRSQAGAPAAPMAPILIPQAPAMVAPTAPQPAVQMAPPTAPQPLGYALVVLTGPLAGRRANLIGSFEIGREGSGLALSGDPNSSRRHAVVETTPLGLSIRDLGSTNGTFVNGSRVTDVALNRGDVVRIGSTEMRVE